MKIKVGDKFVAIDDDYSYYRLYKNQLFQVVNILDYAGNFPYQLRLIDNNLLISDRILAFSEEEMNNLELKVYSMFHRIQHNCQNALVYVNSTVSNYSIADYRRDFNNKFCEYVDVLVWGESDMLVPAQAFQALDILHQQQSSVTPKYLATFAICKMWDTSWKSLEHVDFTDKPFIEGDTTNWWSLRYIMSKEEMDKINAWVRENQLGFRITLNSWKLKDQESFTMFMLKWA